MQKQLEDCSKGMAPADGLLRLMYASYRGCSGGSVRKGLVFAGRVGRTQCKGEFRDSPQQGGLSCGGGFSFTPSVWKSLFPSWLALLVNMRYSCVLVAGKGLGFCSMTCDGAASFLPVSNLTVCFGLGDGDRDRVRCSMSVSIRGWLIV